jgi:hypothetical protein
LEAEIINRLITAILNHGYCISVYDGEEYALERSYNQAAIQEETSATDETTYRMYSREGDYKGFFWLIHGNGEDVISDHSDNFICEEIFNECLA